MSPEDSARALRNIHDCGGSKRARVLAHLGECTKSM